MTQTATPICICGMIDWTNPNAPVGGDCRSLGCDPECEACRGRCEGCDAPATWVYDEVGPTLRHEIYASGASCAPPSIWCDACHDAGEGETVPEYWSRID